MSSSSLTKNYMSWKSQISLNNINGKCITYVTSKPSLRFIKKNTYSLMPIIFLHAIFSNNMLVISGVWTLLVLRRKRPLFVYFLDFLTAFTWYDDFLGRSIDILVYHCQYKYKVEKTWYRTLDCSYFSIWKRFRFLSSVWEMQLRWFVGAPKAKHNLTWRLIDISYQTALRQVHLIAAWLVSAQHYFITDVLTRNTGSFVIKKQYRHFPVIKIKTWLQ